jgi:hypothetical protein
VPLKFTGGLGGELAGRPIAIRYADNRTANGGEPAQKRRPIRPPFLLLGFDY